MEETMVKTMTYNDDLDESDQCGKIELLVSCTELANMDTFSKTDPMCVLFIKRYGQWKEHGRSEAVMDMVNPMFTETFVLDYETEINQQILFSIYDVDSRSTDLQKHDLVGSVQLTVSSLVRQDNTITTTCRSLRAPGDPQSRGLISITTEFIKETRSRLCLHLGASKLDKKGILSTKKTDTYLELSRSINSIDYHPVYRTEVFHKSQDPRWRPFEISIQKLCNGDPDRHVQFSCWHIQSNQERKLVGQLTTTLRNMTNRGTKEMSHLVLPLIEPKKARKKSYKASGQLKFFKCRLDMAYSVLDYVRGGCSLKFMVAIDFTSSNGESSNPMSLHYLDENKDNQYIDAIKTVGSMLSHYDLDQQFQALGFGAKLKAKGDTKACFPLAGKRGGYCVRGIQGILNAYKRMLPNLTFGGPSRLSPVIQTAIDIVKKTKISQDNQLYHVLLIITDGIVNDTDEALQVVLDSTTLPLSIVVVGVGPADFTAMEHFQSTVESLVHNKSMKNYTFAAREHFHFTALRKPTFVGGGNANASIAKETLAKVSTQMVEYLKQNNIIPHKPKLNRTFPTVDGWISKDTNLNDIHPDSEPTPEDLSPYKGGRSMSFKNTLRLKGNTNTNTAVPTCPTCGSTIDSTKENILSTFL